MFVELRIDKIYYMNMKAKILMIALCLGMLALGVESAQASSAGEPRCAACASVEQQAQEWDMGIPVLTALVLGLIAALSPCPLATNIAAIGYISKRIDNRRQVFLQGLLYTLGRVVAYTALGVVLIALLRSGSSMLGVQRWVATYGEMVLGPALIVMGGLILLSDKLRLPSLSNNNKHAQLAQHGGWGALLLGILFALAFCPSSAVLYFGGLIPMSATASMGYLLPVVFAIATALPVLIVAWVLAFSVQHIGKVYGKMQSIQKWLNIIVAIAFIGIGVYYTYNYFSNRNSETINHITSKNKIMEIKVLGTGCSKCRTTYELVEKVIKENGVSAQLEKVEDIMQIMEYDVMTIPCVVIDGEVKIAGRVPTESEIKQLLGL